MPITVALTRLRQEYKFRASLRLYSELKVSLNRDVVSTKIIGINYCFSVY